MPVVVRPGTRQGPPIAALLGAALAVALHAAPARAQIPPIQWQILGLASCDPFGENPSGEAQVNLALAGVGLAIGLGGEALARAGGGEGFDGGGFVDLALQFRPMMLAAAVREGYHATYNIFDPHLDVGGLLGAVAQDGAAEFRGALYAGASLDFGIPTRNYWLDAQVLITIGYRYTILQDPDPAPAHHILLGVGYRAGL
jgi:hypothetical protein